MEKSACSIENGQTMQHITTLFFHWCCLLLQGYVATSISHTCSSHQIFIQTPFEWMAEQDQAFKAMKALVASEALLAYPDHNKSMTMVVFVWWHTTLASSMQLNATILPLSLKCSALSKLSKLFATCFLVPTFIFIQTTKILHMNLLLMSHSVLSDGISSSKNSIQLSITFQDRTTLLLILFLILNERSLWLWRVQMVHRLLTTFS